MVCAAELGVRRAGQDALDAHVWQRDQVVFVEGVDVQDCVPDLLDLDACAVEGDLLAGVALRVDAGRVVVEVAGGDGRVVRDLFAD